MPKGGYIIIDFKGIDLAGDNVKIDGIFRAVTNAYKKAVQITGIVIDGVEYPDAFVAIKSNVIEVYGAALTVQADDTIKYLVNDGNITLAHGDYTAQDLILYKKHGIVFVSQAFYVPEAVTENDVLYTLPEGWRPKYYSELIVHKVGGGTYTMVFNPANGQITANHGFTGNEYIIIDWSYLAQ